MAYTGFVGNGYVGNFLTLEELEAKYPAQGHAGRRATVETNGVVSAYFSTGETWASEVVATTNPLTGKVDLIGPDGLPMDLGGGNAWRPATYFAIGSNGLGGDLNGATTPTRAITTDHQMLQSFKVLRRTTRFRLWFSNGTPGCAGTAFTLSGKTEVPTKNSSGIAFLPWKFNGQPSYSVPANGGALWCTDWQSWPVEAGDMIYPKSYCYNGGSAFTLPALTMPETSAAVSPSGDWDSVKENVGADSSGVQKGTGVWNASAYVSAGFRCLMIETDCQEEGRSPTVDLWGDSIGYGMNGTVPSWLNQVVMSAGVPFANYCVAGSSQNHVPSRALTRMGIARGDIAICEHGKNAPTATANLLALWKYLRGLGYRKIIQTTTTNGTDAANATVTENNALMRAFINANKGVGDGPDVVWDMQAFAQNPATGLWNPGYDNGTDGTHLSAAGDNGVAAAGIAAGWKLDLA